MTHKAQIIDGRKYAAQYLEKVAGQVRILGQQHGITPGLAVILVGDNVASQIYVNNKMQRAQEVGIDVFFQHFDAYISPEVLLAHIAQLNTLPKVHGILLQLPLPVHLSAETAINLIDPSKDVDGLHYVNVGKLNKWQDCLEPCTPRGCLMLIKDVLGTDLSGYKAVVIGRSQIVGRPMASMLLRENCTVTVVHSRSKNIVEEVRTADIVVSAVGQPHMVKSEWIKPGACVIDVGQVRRNGKVYGDVDFDNVKQIAGSITPVPGGVGPMTIACMLGNTVKAAILQNQININDV